MNNVALKSREGFWVMSSAIMASAMAFIDGTALNVVLPSLQTGLHASGTDLFWILNAYLLILASLILIGGSLGDKLGHKKVFMLGIFIFIIGSGLCGIAADVLQLILFRLLQGMGGALMIPGSLSLISAAVLEKERGRAIGVWSAATTVVTVGGPILGGALADAGLWRYIFFINLPIGIITLLILAFKVKEIRNEEEDKTIDIPGAIAITLSLAALTYGFLRLPETGWSHWEIYMALGSGLLLLIVFLFIEKKSPHPMMPLQLFRDPVFSSINLLSFFLYAGLGAAMLFVSLNLVQVQGYTQLQSGLVFLPFTLLLIALSGYAGKMADKHGPRRFLLWGPVLTGAGMLALAFTGQTQGIKAYWTTFFPGILLMGLGMAITVAPLTATVMGAVSGKNTGIASGINNAVTRIASVFANAILGALAIFLMRAAVQKRLDLPWEESAREKVLEQVKELGNARPPSFLNKVQQEQVLQIYHLGFIDTFRIILMVSAIMCWVGALITVLMIRKRKE